MNFSRVRLDYVRGLSGLLYDFSRYSFFLSYAVCIHINFIAYANVNVAITWLRDDLTSLLVFDVF